MERERKPFLLRSRGEHLGCHQGPSLSILLIDDDLEAAFGLSIALRLQGHRVVMALSGPEALQSARANPPDVVFVEIDLPEMDGWEIVRQFYAQGQPAGKRPLYIAMARHGYENDYQRSGREGIDLFLKRPLDTGFINQLLDRFYRVVYPDAVQTPIYMTLPGREAH